MRSNYHAHTVRCNHAQGTEEAYIEQAIAEGFDIFGFSDHGPYPELPQGPAGIRMKMEEFPDYVRTIRGLQKKYSGKIRIGLGIESEYFPEKYNWLKETKEESGLDYILLGNHFAPESEDYFYFGNCKDVRLLKLYVDLTLKGMETGLFAYFAHPDLVFRCFDAYNADAKAAGRDICRAAKQHGYILEYNLQGMLNVPKSGIGYPCMDFWEQVAAEGCKTIIGVDAHQPEKILAERVVRAEEVLKTLNLVPETDLHIEGV